MNLFLPPLPGIWGFVSAAVCCPENRRTSAAPQLIRESASSNADDVWNRCDRDRMAKLVKAVPLSLRVVGS
ncbi:MAG: hypothetical protein AAF609_17890 [Cyanobacteria bacterium P01_C01_bin.120]